MAETHVPPTPAQRQHVTEAVRNPQLAAKANGGHPPVAATARPASFNGPGVVSAKGAPPRVTPPAARTPPANGGAPPGAALKPQTSGAPHPQTNAPAAAVHPQTTAPKAPAKAPPPKAKAPAERKEGEKP